VYAKKVKNESEEEERHESQETKLRMYKTYDSIKIIIHSGGFQLSPIIKK
jgi:hypothetical protein